MKVNDYLELHDEHTIFGPFHWPGFVPEASHRTLCRHSQVKVCKLQVVDCTKREVKYVESKKEDLYVCALPALRQVWRTFLARKPHFYLLSYLAVNYITRRHGLDLTPLY